MKAYFLVLFVVSLVPHLGYASLRICPASPIVSVINVGFNFKSSKHFALPGVNEDLKTMQKMYGEFKNKTFIRDNDVTDKASFLQLLREGMKKGKNPNGKSTVIFNFAGHGILTTDGTFAIPLPHFPTKCIIEKEMYFDSKNQATSVYRGLYSSSYVEKENTRGLSRVTPKKIDVFNDTDPACAKYMVTSKDLSETFKDVDLFGIVDSCHSGAVSQETKMNTIFSAQADELAADNKGGAMFNYVKKLMGEYSCSVTQGEARPLTMKDLAESLPGFSLNSTANKIKNPNETVRGLTRDVYSFGNQKPGVSSSFNMNKSVCLTLNSTQTDTGSRDKICKNPVGENHQVGPQGITCSNKTTIKPGTPILVTNKSKNLAVVYDPGCGYVKANASDVKLIESGVVPSQKQNTRPTQKGSTR